VAGSDPNALEAKNYQLASARPFADAFPVSAAQMDVHRQDLWA